MIPQIPPDKRRGNNRERNSFFVSRELIMRKAKIKKEKKKRKLSATSKGRPQKEALGQRENRQENKRERKIKEKER